MKVLLHGLGSNQYVNSSAVGRYADYLTRELVPFVEFDGTHSGVDYRMEGSLPFLYRALR